VSPVNLIFLISHFNDSVCSENPTVTRCGKHSLCVRKYIGVSGLSNYYCYFFIILSGVRLRLSPLGTATTTELLYQPQMMDGGDCGTIIGMRIGRGNRSTRRKPAPVPHFPPQIPHDLTRAQTRPAAVGSQRLTT
jgi:hypothetical protein